MCTKAYRCLYKIQKTSNFLLTIQCHETSPPEIIQSAWSTFGASHASFNLWTLQIQPSASLCECVCLRRKQNKRRVSLHRPSSWKLVWMLWKVAAPRTDGLVLGGLRSPPHRSTSLDNTCQQVRLRMSGQNKSLVLCYSLLLFQWWLSRSSSTRSKQYQ